MKKNLLFIIFFSLPSLASANASTLQKWNPNWSACKTDADCTQVKSCCSWTAINKNSASAVQTYETKTCTKVECAAPPINRNPLTSCVNHVCKAQSFKTKN